MQNHPCQGHAQQLWGPWPRQPITAPTEKAGSLWPDSPGKVSKNSHRSSPLNHRTPAVLTSPSVTSFMTRSPSCRAPSSRGSEFLLPTPSPPPLLLLISHITKLVEVRGQLWRKLQGRGQDRGLPRSVSVLSDSPTRPSTRHAPESRPPELSGGSHPLAV